MRRKLELTGRLIDRDYPYGVELMAASAMPWTDHRTRSIGRVRQLAIGGDPNRRRILCEPI